MPRLFEQTMWYILNTYFPREGLKFWYDPGRQGLCDYSPIKTLGTLMAFFPNKIYVLRFDCEGIKIIFTISQAANNQCF